MKETTKAKLWATGALIFGIIVGSIAFLVLIKVAEFWSNRLGLF